MTDPQCTGRLTAIMKKINLEDGTEARGVRKVEISTQRTYLYGFGFDKNIIICKCCLMYPTPLHILLTDLTAI
jgi:hypothetical protein